MSAADFASSSGEIPEPACCGGGVVCLEACRWTRERFRGGRLEADLEAEGAAVAAATGCAASGTADGAAGVAVGGNTARALFAARRSRAGNGLYLGGSGWAS